MTSFVTEGMALAALYARRTRCTCGACDVLRATVQLAASELLRDEPDQEA